LKLNEGQDLAFRISRAQFAKGFFDLKPDETRSAGEIKMMSRREKCGENTGGLVQTYHRIQLPQFLMRSFSDCRLQKSRS